MNTGHLLIFSQLYLLMNMFVCLILIHTDLPLILFGELGRTPEMFSP